MDTHTLRVTGLVLLELPVRAGPDVAVRVGGHAGTARLILEVDLRVREARNAAHLGSLLCRIVAAVFSHWICLLSSRQVEVIGWGLERME